MEPIHTVAYWQGADGGLWTRKESQGPFPGPVGEETSPASLPDYITNDRRLAVPFHRHRIHPGATGGGERLATGDVRGMGMAPRLTCLAGASN